MSLRNTIQEAQKIAMKEGKKDSLSTLRMLWSALRNAEIDKGSEMVDEEIQQLITRQVKQLKDACSDFEKGGRSDLIEQSKKEVAFLSQYLPEQFSDDELLTLVQSVIAKNTGEKNTGVIMGAVMKEVNGKADGKRVREIVMKILQP